MIKKVCLLFSLLLVVMVFPAWGAMSDGAFFNLCSNGSVQEIQETLQQVANPNTVWKEGITPLELV